MIFNTSKVWCKYISWLFKWSCKIFFWMQLIIVLKRSVLIHPIMSLASEAVLRRCFLKIGRLKNSTNLTGKHLCWSFFLIKLQAWRPATLLKRNSNTDDSCETCEIFKSTFLAEHLWWLLLFLILINPFHARGLFLYTLKILENRRFSNVSSGVIERDQRHEMTYGFIDKALVRPSNILLVVCFLKGL